MPNKSIDRLGTDYITFNSIIHEIFSSNLAHIKPSVSEY